MDQLGNPGPDQWGGWLVFIRLTDAKSSLSDFFQLLSNEDTQ